MFSLQMHEFLYINFYPSDFKVDLTINKIIPTQKKFKTC